MAEPIIPNTGPTRLGYGLLWLSVPFMGYKTFLRLTGRPLDTQSVPVLVLAGIALFGIVVGLALLGIETIRAAIRDTDAT
jgi:hypothetical protein